MPESKFTPAQAVELAAAFAQHKVDYLFIGKSGAILLGYPAVTQDVDLFLPKDRVNASHVLKALGLLGFDIPPSIRRKILRGADFVQLKDGPFDLDLVHAPDGISSYAAAKSRSLIHDGFPVANLRDIIASKRASGRQKDLMDLDLLEEFRRGTNGDVPLSSNRHWTKRSATQRPRSEKITEHCLLQSEWLAGRHSSVCARWSRIR